jgi:hypothetical protein
MATPPFGRLPPILAWIVAKRLAFIPLPPASLTIFLTKATGAPLTRGNQQELAAHNDAK